MCSCVPVWKGRGFLGENSERCTTVEGYQGGRGWGISRAGLASLLAICWVCSRRAFSSSSVVPEAQLVSEGRVRVPSPIDRSWWLMGSSEDSASPAGPSLSSLTPPALTAWPLPPAGGGSLPRRVQRLVVGILGFWRPPVSRIRSQGQTCPASKKDTRPLTRDESGCHRPQWWDQENRRILGPDGQGLGQELRRSPASPSSLGDQSQLPHLSGGADTPPSGLKGLLGA